jgi:D-amino-acid dehydrogenase
LVAVYESDAGLAAGRAHAELVARFGIPFEPWSADEVRRREPAVRGRQAGGFFFPEDGHCEPYGAVVALAAEARRAGVRCVEGAEVYGAEREGRAVRALLTTRGRVAAGQVVLAAGAWSRPLGRLLGLDLPVLGGKGYSVVVPPLDPHPTRSLMLSERKVAINPHADALRISGTLELVGLDLEANRRRLEAVVRGARGVLALPEPLEVREVWRGLRPCTPDGMPLIGRARSFDNLWLATGHQMTGLKTAPGTGRLLAELVGGEAPTFDPAPFRADRY